MAEDFLPFLFVFLCASAVAIEPIFSPYRTHSRHFAVTGSWLFLFQKRAYADSLLRSSRRFVRPIRGQAGPFRLLLASSLQCCTSANYVRAETSGRNLFPSCLSDEATLCPV